MTKRQSGIDRRTVLGAIGAGGALSAGSATTLAQTAPVDGLLASATALATPPASAAAAKRAVAEASAAIIRLSREVWANAELSLAEVKSHQIHIRELEAAGFRIASRAKSGIPTAFIAEWSQGAGGPTIGYLPEYDALPGLGNAAEPRQTPGPTGAAVGHGCGHNIPGAGCTGAAIALKRMMEEQRTPGRVRVYGCAAEELEGAKVYMARDGLFDDCDVALAWHSAPFAGAGNVRLAATNKMMVKFHGKTAHAGNAPWEGRSALKAAELFGSSVQMMREHMLPTSRLHYVYEAAGVAPNVVPDFAQIWIVNRAVNRPTLNGITEWLEQAAKGVAMATKTTAEFDRFYGTYDLLPNDPLARHLYRHILATPIAWTEAEQTFAKACQREMKVKEDGMSTRPMPFINDITAGAGSDLGDVSYNTPTGVFGWPTLPLNIGLHTWPVTACGGMSIGDKGALNTATILAGAGFDLMTDAALRDAAKADFLKRRGDEPFVSPLPPSRRTPLALPAYLVKTGEDEVFANVTPA